jgi:hypothetical protein
MSSSFKNNIAKKARTKSEADFATWLIRAKLGASMTFRQTYTAF